MLTANNGPSRNDVNFLKGRGVNEKVITAEGVSALLIQPKVTSFLTAPNAVAAGVDIGPRKFRPFFLCYFAIDLKHYHTNKIQIQTGTLSF